MKTRPSTSVPDRGPVLGEPEARGQRFEEREDHREHDIKREDETRTGLEFGVWQEWKSEEILVSLPLSSYLIPLIHSATGGFKE